MTHTENTKENMLQQMIDRFLSWKLPNDFSPDAGITFQPDFNGGKMKHEPTGTNLFTAMQAKAMIEIVLGDSLETYAEARVREEKGEWYIGKKVHVFNEDFVVVGITTMTYDNEGEPEWKITNTVQEVALVKYCEGISYQKPTWYNIETLTHMCVASAKRHT